MITVFQFAQKHEKVFFFAVASWFCLEYYILGPFSYIRKGDNADSIVPRALTVWDSITSEGISYWYHLLGGGVDRLANEIVAARLDSFFFFLFPGWLATALLLMLGTFVGGYFVYLICIEYLQLQRGVSYMAGTLFAASLISIDIIPMVMGLAMFPVAVYSLEKLAVGEKRSLGKKYVVVTFLALLFGLSNSLVLTLPFMLGGLFIWFGFIRRNFSPPFVLLLGIFAIISWIPSIPEMWSLFVNAPLSQRAGDFYQNIGLLNYVVRVMDLIRENLLWLVILLVGAIQKNKPPLAIRLSFVALFLLFGAPSFISIAQLLKPYLGFLSDFGFSRFDSLIPFFGILAAAVIVNLIPGKCSFTSHNGSHKLFTAQSVILSAILVGVLIGSLDLKVDRTIQWIKKGGYMTSSYSEDLEYVAAVEQRNPEKTPFRVAVITDRSTELIPTIAHFHNLETIDGHANITSKQFLDYFRVMSKDGQVSSSLYFLWDSSQEERDRFSSNPSDVLDLEMLSLANVKYVASSELIHHPDFKLLDTPYAQRGHKEWNQMRWKEKLQFRLAENFRGRNLLVYENTSAFPRFYLTNYAKTFTSDAELLKAVSAASAEELKESVFLMAGNVESTPNELAGEVKQEVRLERYASDYIELKTFSDAESWLVITNNFHPSWKAYINDAEVKILPAYHTFMAIPVPSGENQIVIKYKPSYASPH